MTLDEQLEQIKNRIPVHIGATMLGDNGDCGGRYRKRAGNHRVQRL